jgi:hypothetical protein
MNTRATHSVQGRGGARPGAGRKPVARAEKRRNRLTIYFTDAELDVIEAAASASRPIEWARATLLRSARRQKR